MQASSPMSERRVDQPGLFGTPYKSKSSVHFHPTSINPDGTPATGNEENTTNGVDPSIDRTHKRVRMDRTPSKIASLRKKATANMSGLDLGLAERTQHETKSECGPASVSDLRGWLTDFSKHQNGPLPPGGASKSAVIPSSQSEATRSAAKTRFRENQASRTAPSSASRPPMPSSANKGPKSVQSAATNSQAANAASTIVSRIVDRKGTPGKEPRKNFTSIRVKPKFNKEEVQATDHGYASVAKLSEWLANDPTSQKKLRHVRKGKNVIAKSRQFEKDMEDVIVEENSIERGAVSGKKKWLKDAFHGEHEDDDSSITVPKKPHAHGHAQTHTHVHANAHTPARNVKNPVGGYRESPKHPFRSPAPSLIKDNATINCAQSEIIVNDAASIMSVSDKKDWLKNAFKKADGTPIKSIASPAVPPRASSDVMHARGESRDEVTARAKRKWLERSARKTAGPANTPMTTPAKQSVGVKPQPTSESISAQLQEAATLLKNDHDASISTADSMKSTIDYRESFDDKSVCSSKENNSPPQEIRVASSVEQRTGPPQTWKDQVQEDRSSVDFRAARELLIQRSKVNGNELRVASKVLNNKNKFERIGKEITRRSGAHGLLKPSWGQVDPSGGGPSGINEKTYVDDIAPKRSFEELP